MIRPCDQCGGTGIIPRSLESVGGRCLRCVDMPTLDWQVFVPPWIDEQDYSGHPWSSRTSSKPDPDSVMRWCSVHECKWQDPNDSCDSWWNLDDHPTPCDIGWVERPIRLQEVP